MELHVTAIEQLTTSLQSSTRSMKKVVQRRSTADKKKQTAEEDNQQQQMKDYLQAESVRVKMLSQYNTSSAVFFLDYPALGHPSVAIYQGKVALQMVGAKLFSAPAKCGDQFEVLDSIPDVRAI